MRMKVDLCDLKRLLRADFFAKDRDVTLQSDRNFYLGDGTQIDSESNLLPDGGIVLMFSGAVVDIPTGWQLADGTNGTSDLVDMFVVGAGNTYNPGDTGGADTVNISHTHTSGSYNAANDTHNHDVAGTSGGGTDHTHGSGSYAAGISGSADTGVAADSVSLLTKSHTHPVSGTSSIETSHTHGSGSYNPDNDTHDHDVNSGATASGGSATQDVLNPYHALAYIQRLT